MTAIPAISKTRPKYKSMDYDLLRAEGIQHLEELATELWTDFNAHDPGITFLEVLCYALADLGYRRHAIPVEDLFRPADPQHHFFLPHQILSNEPVTAADFRKIMIDVPGVRNAWVKKFDDLIDDRIYNGLYSITLDFENQVNTQNRHEVQQVIDRVLDRLHAHRGLCEDFQEINYLKTIPAQICLDLEIEPEADEEQVFGQVVWQLQEYLTPSVRFYTLREMLQKREKAANPEAYSLEQMFNGPLLDHGFIDTAELNAAQQRKMIYKSDLVNLIMSVPGVTGINEMQYRLSDTAVFADMQDSLPVPDDSKIVIDLCCSCFFASRGEFTNRVPDDAVRAQVDRLRLLHECRLGTNPGRPAFPNGLYREDLGDYRSVQFDLPRIYHVGDNILTEDGTPPGQRRVTPAQKAQSKQLQAYLLFFDQILAGYLAQLGRVRDLFSKEQNINTPGMVAAALYEVPGVRQLLTDFPENGSDADWENFTKNGNNPYLNKLRAIAENRAQYEDRKNRLLNHLLARFGEAFTDYALALLRADVDPSDNPWDQPFDQYLAAKARFLRDLPETGAERGKAYNYRRYDPQGNRPDVWNSSNVAGLKKRVCRLLGIDDWSSRSVICEPSYLLDILQKGAKQKVSYYILLKDRATGEVLMSSERFTSAKAAREERTLLYEQLHQTELLLEEDGKVIFEYLDPEGKAHTLRTVSAKPAKEVKSSLARIKRLLEPAACSREGFHLLEHILIRPGEELDTPLDIAFDCCIDGPTDPYSFWLSIFLPDWGDRFGAPAFRRFVENTFRAEAPAHIGLRFCWLDENQMPVFENLYKDWMEAKAACRPDDCAVSDTAEKLIVFLKTTPCSCLNAPDAPATNNCVDCPAETAE